MYIYLSQDVVAYYYGTATVLANKLSLVDAVEDESFSPSSATGICFTKERSEHGLHAFASRPLSLTTYMLGVISKHMCWARTGLSLIWNGCIPLCKRPYSRVIAFAIKIY